MNNNITILIDMDDVLCSFMKALCECLDKIYHTNVFIDDVRDWRLTKAFPSLTEEEIFAPTHTEDFWNTVQPKDEAVKYTKMLIDEGYNVYICTASNYNTIKPKFDLVIKRYFPFITWDKMIITSHKSMVKGDILVDDGVHNLRGTNFKKILVSAPHNLSYDAEADGMVRTENWEEIYKAIHRFSEN